MFFSIIFMIVGGRKDIKFFVLLNLTKQRTDHEKTLFMHD